MSGTLSRKLRSLRSVFARHGAWRTAGHAASVTLWGLRLWRGGLVVTCDADGRPAAAGIASDEGECRIAERGELLAHARAGQSGLWPGFVDQRLAAGDRCVALVRDGALIAYQWYATAPLRQFGVPWAPGPGYVLHHRIWMDPALRGRHLTERLFDASLALVREPWMRRVVGVVEFANYASRHALGRMGMRASGFIMQFGPDALHLAVSRLRGAPLVRASWPPR